MIIASAVKVTKDDVTFVIMGRRHCSCFRVMEKAGVKRPFEEEQGFVTDKFVFVTRLEAKRIAEECNQILEGEGMYRELFSEDIFEPVPSDMTGHGEVSI